jgi:hypothetical protein
MEASPTLVQRATRLATLSVPNELNPAANDGCLVVTDKALETIRRVA